MKIQIILALAILLLGIVLDFATTSYGLNKGFIETRPFSSVLKIALLPILGLFILLKFRPDFIDRIVIVFCLSFGSVFVYAAIQNLMVTM